jgi:hypothetical protein
MKRIIFTILWTFLSFIVGLAAFAIIYITAFIQTPPHLPRTSPEVQFWTRAIELGLLFPIGLPSLALFLGIFGQLPGTRSKMTEEKPVA